MIEKFEYKGYWHLPSDPDNAIAGILTYIPNESILLELIGSFGKSKTNVANFIQRNNEDIIFGITSDAHKITLINCIPHGGNLNLSCPFPISKYSIKYCLDGIYIDKFIDKKFSWCNIDIPTLTMWCHPGALKTVYSKNDKFNRISVSYNKDEEPISSVDINCTTTLNIKKDVKFKESKFKLSSTFNQSTFLQIQKSCKSSISDFLSNIFLFENFMSLITLSTVKVSKILLYDETNYQELKNKERIYHPIELFYVEREAISKINQEYDFLFSYPEVQDIYPDIIKKWYNEKSGIEPIRAHLIKSVKSKHIFDSTDFLIIIQAIEGFCIRFRKEQKTLTETLESIIDEFKDIDKLKQSNINIKATVDSRHYYSHFMNKTKKPNTLDGLELLNLTSKLRVLLICCLLNFIGVNNQKINELLNKSNNINLQ